MRVSNFGRMLSKLRACSASLNTSRSFLFAVQTQTNLKRQNFVIIHTFLCNPNLFPCWKCILNQLLLKSIPIVISSTLTNSWQYSNIMRPLHLDSFEIQNMFWPLAIRGHTWSSQQSICFLRKNLIFHINTIQTAVKKITTTVFVTAANPVTLRSVNFVTSTSAVSFASNQFKRLIYLNE